MNLVIAALKGGVGKTTTAVYLAAVAASSRRTVVLVDADPQASAADWLEVEGDVYLERITLVEAPTERLLLRALDRLDSDTIAVIDTPPGQERVLERAMERADAVVVPTRIGGVEIPPVETVLGLVPRKTPAGLVICSARTHTRDFQEGVDAWTDAGVTVWGHVPERVAIAAGPSSWLADDGIEAYRAVWRRASRAAGRH